MSLIWELVLHIGLALVAGGWIVLAFGAVSGDAYVETGGASGDGSNNRGRSVRAAGDAPQGRLA